MQKRVNTKRRKNLKEKFKYLTIGGITTITFLIILGFVLAGTTTEISDILINTTGRIFSTGDIVSLGNINATKFHEDGISLISKYLGISDQRYNETSWVNLNFLQLTDQRYNETIWVDINFLRLTDMRFNETDKIDSLNITKLDKTDQRYNETTYVNSNFLPLSGGTMTGNLLMGGKNINQTGNIEPNTDNVFDIGSPQRAYNQTFTKEVCLNPACTRRIFSNDTATIIE